MGRSVAWGTAWGMGDVMREVAKNDKLRSKNAPSSLALRAPRHCLADGLRAPAVYFCQRIT